MREKKTNPGEPAREGGSGTPRAEQTLQAMKESREWLRVTLSSIGDGVICTDAHGCVTLVNPVAQALTG